jgi:hypothetical protein
MCGISSPVMLVDAWLPQPHYGPERRSAPSAAPLRPAYRFTMGGSIGRPRAVVRPARGWTTGHRDAAIALAAGALLAVERLAAGAARTGRSWPPQPRNTDSAFIKTDGKAGLTYHHLVPGAATVIVATVAMTAQTPTRFRPLCEALLG